MLGGESATYVLGPTAVLLLFSGLFTVTAAVEFRFEESKVYVA